MQTDTSLDDRALTMIIAHLEASSPIRISKTDFLNGLRGASVDTLTNHAIHAFLSEAEEASLADLALANLDGVDFRSLARIARTTLDVLHPNRVYLEELAG